MEKQIGLPELTDSYLAGQDVLYEQFNDLSFFVEDTNQEYFYLNILKKLFPGVKLTKIFPLNGKLNVIAAAQTSVGNKRKIYIVDLDFDEILNYKKRIENLFYLEKYSIENHLISKNAIFEIIREKNPKLKNENIEAILDCNFIFENCRKLLWEISCSCLVIKKYELGISYCSINPPQDFDFSTVNPTTKGTTISDFFSTVENSLKAKDSRMNRNAQIKKYRIHYSSLEKALTNIPGKYLLKIIKYILETKKLINQISLESFTYKLAKEYEPSNLNFLKVSINNYIN